MANKRGHNEGSLFKRKDGVWVAELSLGYENGRRKRKQFYAKTRQEAHTAMVEAQRNSQLGLNVAPKRQTVEQFLTHWLKDVVGARVRPSTFRSYSQIVNNHLIPGLGRMSLQKLTPQQVQHFLAEKHKQGISAEHLRRVLRAALNQAMKWDLVARNVAALASAPKQARFEVSFLDTAQARQLLEGIEDASERALITLTVALGLRLGEVLGLRWQDVDLSDGSLNVRYQLQSIDGKPKLVEPKTHNARRSLPLPAFLVDALCAHRSQQLEVRFAHLDVWRDLDFVFTSRLGTPLDGRNVRRTLQRALTAAKLPHIRFHDLRHTCASLLLARNVHPRVVMETLGHSQIALTLNTYSHVIPALQREAANEMQALLA